MKSCTYYIDVYSPDGTHLGNVVCGRATLTTTYAEHQAHGPASRARVAPAAPSVPSDDDLRSAYVDLIEWGGGVVPEDKERTAHEVALLVLNAQSWDEDVAYATFRVGVCLYGWHWDGFDKWELRFNAAREGVR